jgi:toxin HigB-1
MIAGFRSKALRQLWFKRDASGIRPDWVNKIRLILSRLDAAETPEDLDLPGFGFHALTGNLAGRYSLIVSRNWRITFSWDRADATEVDLEDYHGR